MNIDELKNQLKNSINEISVYDFNSYTSIELYYKIANKVNEIIKELERHEILVSDEIIKQNNALQEMLDSGLHNEVVNKINNMVNDGTMDLIINQNVFEELNSQIKDIENIVNMQGVNICDFGAKPNDINFDNYNSINEAIKYAVNHNINSCFIPAGTFYIKTSKPIYIPSNFTMYGVGYSSVIKRDTNSYKNNTEEEANIYAYNSIISQGNPFTLQVEYDSHNNGCNICIYNLCVDGSISHDTDMSYITDVTPFFYGFGINLTYIKNIKINNVEIKNTANTGLYFYRSYEISVMNCDIHDCGKNLFVGAKVTRNGISVTGTEKVDVIGNIVTNCRIYNNGDMGIQFAFTPIIISNNQIYNNCDCGIESDSSFSSGSVDENHLGDIIITGNYIKGHTYEAMNIAGDKCSNKIISNNIIRQNGGGIFTSDSEGVVGSTNISNNILAHNVTKISEKALICYNGKGSCIIESNQFYNNDCSTSHNISVPGTPRSCIINNNNIDDIGSQRCIYCTGNEISILNNRISASTNIRISGIVNTLKIYNNMLYSTYNFLNISCKSISKMIFEKNIINYVNNIDSYACTISNPTTAYTINYLRICDNHLDVPSSWKCGRLIEFGANININKCIYSMNDFIESYATWGNMVKFTNTPVKLLDVNNIKTIN